MSPLLARSLLDLSRSATIIASLTINGVVALLVVAYIAYRIRRCVTAPGRADLEKKAHAITGPSTISVPLGLSKDATVVNGLEILNEKSNSPRTASSPGPVPAIAPSSKKERRKLTKSPSSGSSVASPASDSAHVEIESRPVTSPKHEDELVPARSQPFQRIRPQSASVIMTRNAANINSPQIVRPAMRQRSMTTPGPAPLGPLPPLPIADITNSGRRPATAITATMTEPISPHVQLQKTTSEHSTQGREHNSQDGITSWTGTGTLVRGTSDPDDMMLQEEADLKTYTTSKRLSRHKRQSAMVFIGPNVVNLRKAAPVARPRSVSAESTTTISASGSPSKQWHSSHNRLIDDISTSDSSHSSPDDSFMQWLANSPARRPSILKGSPGAKGPRKGHRRKNCVRISTRSPEILHFTGQRSSFLDEISEESAAGDLGCGSIPRLQSEGPQIRSRSAHGLGNIPYLEPTRVRASLTPSSPTLTFAYLEQDITGGSNVHSRPSFRGSAAFSSRSSDASLLSIPSLSTIRSSFDITEPLPTPTFELTRPSGEFSDRNSFPFEFDTPHKPTIDNDVDFQLVHYSGRGGRAGQSVASPQTIRASSAVAVDSSRPVSGISTISLATVSSSSSASLLFDDGHMELCSDPLDVVSDVRSMPALKSLIIPSKRSLVLAHLKDKENALQGKQSPKRLVTHSSRTKSPSPDKSSPGQSTSVRMSTSPSTLNLRRPLSILAEGQQNLTRRSILSPFSRARSSLNGPRPARAEDLRRSIVKLRRMDSDMQLPTKQTRESRRYLRLGREESILLPTHYYGADFSDDRASLLGEYSPSSDRNAELDTDIAVYDDGRAHEHHEPSAAPHSTPPATTKTDFVASPVSSLRSFAEEIIHRDDKSGLDDKRPTFIRPPSDLDPWDAGEAAWEDIENTSPRVRTKTARGMMTTPRRATLARDIGLSSPHAKYRQYSQAELEALMGLSPSQSMFPETPSGKRAGVVGVEVSPTRTVLTPKSLYDAEGFFNEIVARYNSS